MKRLALLTLILAFTLPLAGQQYHSDVDKVVNSSHDFSVTSPANIKAASGTTGVCDFCHTPHNASPAVPLWNHTSSGVTYQVYQSSTLTSTVSQPMGGDSSKLCLSCHDGTVALGDTVNNGMIPFNQNATPQGMLPPNAPSNLGINLADDHPIAFVPNTTLNNQLRFPPLNDPVHLDAQQKVQCTSCHDAHNEKIDPVEQRFLVKVNSGSAVCTTCHDLKGGAGANIWSWSGTQGLPSSHQVAINQYNASTNAGGVAWLGAHTGYTTVSTNGCEACHRPHTAHDAQRLMKGEVDLVCFQCHDGNTTTALPNLRNEFNKQYIHPSIGVQAGHDPAEAPNNITTRHASCDDCHNSHAARANQGVPVPPQLSGSLLGLTGISASGSAYNARTGSGEAQYEYEVCFKCHSYNTNQPQASPAYTNYGQLPNRQNPSIDLRQAFTSLGSAHSVVQPGGLSTGLGGAVPSLLPNIVDVNGSPIQSRPLSAGSQIYCIDCHNNNDGRNAGAGYLGSAGPHGSIYPHLLERNYLIETPSGAPGSTAGQPYSTANYMICWKCHSEQSILANQDGFPHKDHVAVAGCSTCHDPHGVVNGNAVNNSYLINFDLNVVAPYNGTLQYTNMGLLHGSCTLTCHGTNHSGLSY